MPAAMHAICAIWDTCSILHDVCSSKAHLCLLLQAPCTSSDLKQQALAELGNTCKAWSTWAVVLRWINLAASACEGSKPSMPLHTLLMQMLVVFAHCNDFCMYALTICTIVALHVYL